MENLNANYTNVPSRGLLTDVDEYNVSKEFYTYARNANLNTHQGKISFLTNEPSNGLCVAIPYTCIGFVKLIGGQYALFLTDNSNSEIGIFDSNLCTYTKVVNSACLNFNTSNLVKASSKENFDCSQSIYWTDGLNPRRYLNLSAIPYTYKLGTDVCQTKEFTNQLDCNEILMTPNVTIPVIDVNLAGGGELQNGAYQFGIAYTINENRVSDYYGITVPQDVWSHLNLGQAISLQISNLDRDFMEYQLIVIYTIGQVTTTKSLGFFSTSNNYQLIDNIERSQYTTLPLEDVVTLRPKYTYADDIANNDQYLLWSGVKTRPDLNYQQQAMNIVSKWVLYQVDPSYYANGGTNVGYCRRERYPFGIQWLFTTGEWSSAFHIPGRVANTKDKTQATGADVYEIVSATNPKPTLYYQVYDTSTKGDVVGANASTTGPVLEGQMGYWESTEAYPDNVIQWGEWACTPIRHPQFPGECNAPRYTKGGKWVNLLGVKFENIEQPKDSKGKYITDVVGYRIVRGSRDGNRSVIAKGMFSNVRSYQETLNTGGDNQTVLYPNYPYNSMANDQFISSQQTSYSSGEHNYNPLSTVLSDQFNFHSPHTLFNNTALGEEVIIETEEVGDVTGAFTKVFNHPKAKVLSNSVFWIAIAVGAIDGVLSVFGKRCVTGLKDGTVNIAELVPETSDIEVTAIGMQFLQQCETLANGLTFTQILQLPAAEAVAKAALKILQTAAAAGLAVYYSFNTANQLIQDMESFMTYQDYALQYNSHGSFTNYACAPVDNTRRQLINYQYLYDGINSINSVQFNNYKRENSVYCQFNSSLAVPTNVDTTNKDITATNLCSNPFNSFNTVASMYYGSVNNKVPNQYGQIDSITYQDTGYLDTTLMNTSAIGSTDVFYETDTVFGGDTYVSKFAYNTHHQFFRQNIANSNFPDGTQFDYSQYRNVGYPRFWLSTEKYDVSELIVVGSHPGKLPTNKYNLDCVSNPGSVTSLKLSNVSGYFYLFNNGVVDFYVESDYNLDFRDYSLGSFQNFYSKTQTSLLDIFRSDRIDTPEQFVYDKSLSKQLVENSIVQQRIDYNPTVDMTCFSYYKNRVIYSLPASFDLKADNWLVYLTNNFYDFPLSDFGAITGMHPIDNQQILFTYDKSAPYVTIGRDELQTTSGLKVVIGDAGLFAREPRPLLYTDYWYGNSQGRWAFINTQFGSFYTSQRQGRIFAWRGQIEEITRQGMHWWFKNYMPSMLLKVFPNYPDSDNPVSGVGLTMGWDNTDEKLYISKRDYEVNPTYIGTLTYDTVKAQFTYGGNKVNLGDAPYFNDASWTISYSPKDQAFISWHDWQPDWMIQGEQHFFTIKDKQIWSHNSRTDSFCNFYNQDYPFEIEYLVNNQGNVEILRNVEYILEAGLYYDEGRYFHQVLDANFDTLVVHNLEQSSGYLELKLRQRDSIFDVQNYPTLNADANWVVSYSKVEQKTRVDQFFDLTKDRGEFTHNNYPLWTVSPNGYVKTVTPQAINPGKNPFERKKFRNIWHKIYLSKASSGNTKYIFKIANANNTQSPR